MSPEERQLITGLFDRIRGTSNTPRDPDAEALIADSVRTMPYAPYVLAQAVIVQDQALRAANDRLKELEARLNELEGQGQRQSSGGGFLNSLGSLFGGGAPASQPRAASPWQTQPQQPYPPQQPYQPQPAPGPWGGAPGGGFLGSALSTAAGVTGGVLLADSIRGLFGGGGFGMGGFGSGFGGFGGGETIVNNYYDDTPNPGGDLADVDPGETVADTYDAPDSTDFGSGGDGGTFDV